MSRYRSPKIGSIPHEDQLKLTDDQFNALLAECKEVDVINQAILEGLKKVYQRILSDIGALYGKDSLQYKYMKRKEQTDWAYVRKTEEWWHEGKKRRDKFQEENARKNLNIKRKEQSDLKASQQLFAIWKWGEKLGIDIWANITADEFKELLFNRDRFLYLADAMLRTREDWNDGFYLVESALNHFVSQGVGDLQESMIVANISGCLHAEDGRVFRDCEWNYNVLFDFVQPDIMAAYKAVKELE